jgi:hypothetical protein
MIRSVNTTLWACVSLIFICIALLFQEYRVFAQVKETFAAFEGHYRIKLESGEYFHIAITSRENGLTLTQLWDGKEIRFQPTSEMEFKAIDSPFPLKFTKDANGVITQVLAFNRDLWTRDNDYKPVIKPEVKLTLEQLKVLTGFYQYQSNKNYIEIFIKDNQLMAKQMWDGKEHHLATESEVEVRTLEANITGKFIKNEQGVVTQLHVNNRDLLDKVDDYKPVEKKIVKLTEEQMKAVSGYYQQQNNKDLFVRVLATGDAVIVKQMWDGQEKTFAAESPLIFHSDPHKLVFSKDPDGEVNQFLAFGKDVWKRSNEYKPTEKQSKE